MRTVYLILLAAFVLSSCSAFRGSRKMDMSPFAENTQTLFSEAIKIERPFQFKHLKAHVNIPEFQNMLNTAPPILLVLRGIILYSNQVVAINNSKLSEKDKAEMLATYLKEAMEKVLAKERHDSIQVDLNRAMMILDNIKNSKNYLDAIAAAEPIVHGVVAAVLERIDVIQNSIPAIITGFNREIDKDYAGIKENYLQLGKLQEKTMLSITRLYNARFGDMTQMETALTENPALRNFFPSAEKVNFENLTKAEQYLQNQSREIETMIGYLTDIKAEYIAQQDEISAWRAQLDEKILIARTALAIWARAHKNLGAGIPVPPMIDVGGIANNLAGNAAKAVIP